MDEKVKQELVDSLVETAMLKWSSDPPYELRGAVVDAIKVKLEASPLIEEIAELVIQKLDQDKDKIAEAAVRAVIDGTCKSLTDLYKEVAKKATEAAEKAFRRY